MLNGLSKKERERIRDKVRRTFEEERRERIRFKIVNSDFAEAVGAFKNDA